MGYFGSSGAVSESSECTKTSCEDGRSPGLPCPPLGAEMGCASGDRRIGDPTGAGAFRYLRCRRRWRQLMTDDTIRAVNATGFVAWVGGGLACLRAEANLVCPSRHGCHEGRCEQKMQYEGIRSGERNRQASRVLFQAMQRRGSSWPECGRYRAALACVTLARLSHRTR